MQFLLGRGAQMVCSSRNSTESCANEAFRFNPNKQRNCKRLLNYHFLPKALYTWHYIFFTQSLEMCPFLIAWFWLPFHTTPAEVWGAQAQLRTDFQTSTVRLTAFPWAFLKGSELQSCLGTTGNSISCSVPTSLTLLWNDAWSTVDKHACFFQMDGWSIAATFMCLNRCYKKHSSSTQPASQDRLV